MTDALFSVIVDPTGWTGTPADLVAAVVRVGADFAGSATDAGALGDRLSAGPATVATDLGRHSAKDLVARLAAADIAAKLSRQASTTPRPVPSDGKGPTTAQGLPQPPSLERRDRDYGWGEAVPGTGTAEGARDGDADDPLATKPINYEAPTEPSPVVGWEEIVGFDTEPTALPERKDPRPGAEDVPSEDTGQPGEAWPHVKDAPDQDASEDIDLDGHTDAVAAPVIDLVKAANAAQGVEGRTLPRAFREAPETPPSSSLGTTVLLGLLLAVVLGSFALFVGSEGDVVAPLLPQDAGSPDIEPRSALPPVERADSGELESTLEHRRREARAIELMLDANQACSAEIYRRCADLACEAAGILPEDEAAANLCRQAQLAAAQQIDNERIQLAPDGAPTGPAPEPETP